MTCWVINCPSAAQGPAPRSLFLLYDKKERKKNSKAICINNRRKISHHAGTTHWPLLYRHPKRPRPGLSSHLSPEAPELPFRNHVVRGLGYFRESSHPIHFQRQEKCAVVSVCLMKPIHTSPFQKGGSSGLQGSAGQPRCYMCFIEFKPQERTAIWREVQDTGSSALGIYFP